MPDRLPPQLPHQFSKSKVGFATSSDQVSRDAIDIWRYGVDAVRADRVVESQSSWDGRWLTMGEKNWDLKGCSRLILVGAGKACDGMLLGLSRMLQKSGRPFPSLAGWFNIPEQTASWHTDLPGGITLCQARPPGMNQPTEKVVSGTNEILKLVSNAQRNDCVIALISGGGSALLCSPIDGLSLLEKVELTKALSDSGANIEELNSVRRCLSNVKGGGLARACNAKHLITCILSDVLGDPLEIIASGPTVLTPEPDAAYALKVLDSFFPSQFANIRTLLQKALHRHRLQSKTNPRCELDHVLLANNATAVDAAGQKAVELGYRYWMHCAPKCEGDVQTLGEKIATQLVATSAQEHIDCLISGGEPTVALPSLETRGIGGRNQQLALSVLLHLQRNQAWDLQKDFAFISGGTDGEDGPTDAAGAMINRMVIENMDELGLNPVDYINRCDAYRFFEQTQGLLITGPTWTNVCDLRVAVLSRSRIT
jgi:glycerate 2-kinase